MNRKYESQVARDKSRTIPTGLLGINHRHTQYDIRDTRLFMQNEPNFILKGPTKHKNDANFNPNIYAKIKNFPKKSKITQKISSKIPVSHHFFHSFPFFFYYFHTLFHLFYPPKEAFCPFVQLSNINALNSMYNKDLHNFFTQEYVPRDMRYEKMQNEPNFKPTLIKLIMLSRRRSRSLSRPVGSTPGQKEPNFTHNFSHILTRLRRLFQKKHEIFQKNPKKRFLQILDINTLNSMHNKDLHKIFHPKCPLPVEFKSRLSGEIKCKKNPISNPASKRCPDPPQADSSTHSLFYTFTHSCKTNPISRMLK